MSQLAVESLDVYYGAVHALKLGANDYFSKR